MTFYETQNTLAPAAPAAAPVLDERVRSHLAAAVVCTLVCFAPTGVAAVVVCIVLGNLAGVRAWIDAAAPPGDYDWFAPSRVVPGTSETTERTCPSITFTSDDLPTFGRPTRAMTGFTGRLHGARAKRPPFCVCTRTASPLGVRSSTGAARMAPRPVAKREMKAPESRARTERSTRRASCESIGRTS